MRLAVIIPSRGDRPKFFENCMRMMAAQTLKAEHYQIMDYTPESGKIDITQRYRRGYDELRGHGFDIIAFIEDDDWYSSSYFEYMVGEWEKHGRPNLFGTCYTYYYHIKLKAYYIMEHYDRSSAMNTFIKPDLKLNWCVDEEPYTDLHLWKTVHVDGEPIDKQRIVIKPSQMISVGIKHGIGMVGGGSHHLDPRIEKRYGHPDNGFLRETLDDASFEFYDNYFAQ